MKNDTRTRSPDLDQRCEVVVVGSGPGGAITACLLAEGGREVVLVEEGPDLSSGPGQPFSVEEVATKYRNGGLTVALGSPLISYAEARLVGGGSELNSGFYHVLPESVRDAWRREYGVQGLEREIIDGCFRSLETDLEIGQTSENLISQASWKLAAGAGSVGLTAIQVPRWAHKDPECGERSPLKMTRRSMTKTYLPRFVAAGGVILSSTKVKKITRSTGGWTVCAVRPGGKDLALNAQSVFLCAGAVQTPFILRQSGFKARIGNSFRVHPHQRVIALFREEISGPGDDVPVHQVKGSPYFSFGGSPVSPPFLALSLSRYGVPRDFIVSNWKRLAIFYAMVPGRGVGKVRGSKFFSDPIVSYCLDEADVPDLRLAVRTLGELLFAAGAEAVYPDLALPDCAKKGPCRAPDALGAVTENLSRNQFNLMSVHIMGSCPMGERPKLCATDSFGKVNGLPDLYINDASLLCSTLGVNPQGTIMGIAYRNALKFLGRL